jgi:hypothetical protein
VSLRDMLAKQQHRLPETAPMRPTLLVTSLLLLGLTLPVQAQAPAGKALQRWVDDQGNVHYGDAPPPAAAGKQRDILNVQGRKVGEILKPKTDAEKAEEARKAEQEAQQQKAKRDAVQRDRYLVETYKGEKELLAARDERLKLLDFSVANLGKEIAAQEKEYDAMRAAAADQERAGKPPSEETKARLTGFERDLRAHKVDLKLRQEERAASEQRFEDDLRRFSEIKSGSAAKRGQPAKNAK